MTIADHVAQMGTGPLTEDGLRTHVWPLFSRVMEREEIYLANHSLGRPLNQMVKDVTEGIDAWYAQMDDAWEPWMAEMDRFRGSVARLIDAPDAKCVAPKTAAGQGMRAVLNAMIGERPIRVVATRGEFDSVDFILKVYEQRGFITVDWVEPDVDELGIGLFRTEAIIEKINHMVDLVIVSQVVFGTGQIIKGMDEIVRVAHESGSRVLIDAYHAVGVIPISFSALNADFMIGGSYKYTRGGPGACWLAVHPRHHDLKTLDTGWFAKRDPFAYQRPEIPEFGDSWLESTPPVLPVYQARSGLELIHALGVDRCRAYNLNQQDALRAEFAAVGVVPYLPANRLDFGAFTLLPHRDASGFCRKLKARGLNTDSRGPVVRFGPDILTSRDELKRAAQITAREYGIP